jgi:hypothetical protein
MGADHTTVLDPAGPGRNSVRIKSKKTYDTHVSIYNINHMPQVSPSARGREVPRADSCTRKGCGTWPAVWETNDAADIWPDAVRLILYLEKLRSSLICVGRSGHSRRCK